MKGFIDEDFLLHTDSSQRLYHEYAEHLPIIDYHCHLPAQPIADDINFQNLSQIWLYGDHYKWRAMRTNGIDERFCTGNATDWEKFEQWACTVPYTLRNPLYHWTHLELKRYFDESRLLSKESARDIYELASEKLRAAPYSVRHLLRRMNVQLICTTDDPADDLGNHRSLASSGFEIPVIPTFRPDAAMKIEDSGFFRNYLYKLGSVCGVEIGNFQEYVKALKSRHDYFADHGCRVSDHGLIQIYSEKSSAAELDGIFDKVRKGGVAEEIEIRKFKAALLLVFAEWDWEKGWVQQFHLGALRNTNTRMTATSGADSGWDSIGDFSQASSLAQFLDRLDGNNTLAKTILYNVNPADNHVMATMAGNFNDGSLAGKIQWGAAWWFLDQKDGIVRQINTLSNMSLLSRFIGMLTDSRSFLSYPRHEYFRRILCNLFGEEIEKGELPNDLAWTGKVIADICFHNANKYFNWRG